MSEEHGFHLYRPHPWHGLDIGPNPPTLVTAFIEITPFDVVKFELDKKTGFLRIDRPQRTSSQPPCLYGLVPRTYCAERVHALSPRSERGDGDPLDICVLSERPVQRGEILLTARIVGGFQMIDDGEADDKIVAVLENDTVYDQVKDITGLPAALVERMHHYFLTYKLESDSDPRVSIECTYGHDHASKVVEASMADYLEHFGEH